MVQRAAGATTGKRYDIARSYDWNYNNVPAPAGDRSSSRTRRVAFLRPACRLAARHPGRPSPQQQVDSLLRAVGLRRPDPTRRSDRGYRACYEPPNLLPVAVRSMSGDGAEIPAAPANDPYDTWAISFGMPSKDPATWRADIEKARVGLGPRQVLSVSVVASPKAGWSLRQLAADFAQCAKWAADSRGSCRRSEPLLPQRLHEGSGPLSATPKPPPRSPPRFARASRQRRWSSRSASSTIPDQAEALVRAITPHVDALSSTNSLTAPVRGHSGESLFGGLRRGVGGGAITECCNEELKDAVANH